MRNPARCFGRGSLVFQNNYDVTNGAPSKTPRRVPHGKIHCQMLRGIKLVIKQHEALLREEFISYYKQHYYISFILTNQDAED